MHFSRYQICACPLLECQMFTIGAKVSYFLHCDIIHCFNAKWDLWPENGSYSGGNVASTVYTMHFSYLFLVVAEMVTVCGGEGMCRGSHSSMTMFRKNNHLSYFVPFHGIGSKICELFNLLLKNLGIFVEILVSWEYFRIRHYFNEGKEFTWIHVTKGQPPSTRVETLFWNILSHSPCLLSGTKNHFMLWRELTFFSYSFGIKRLWLCVSSSITISLCISTLQ